MGGQRVNIGCAARALIMSAVCFGAGFGIPAQTHARSAQAQLGFAQLFGGSNTEQAPSVARGNGGSIFLAGTTTSPDWPVPWPEQCLQHGCSHGFVLKLSPDGKTVFYQFEIGGSRST